MLLILWRQPIDFGSDTFRLGFIFRFGLGVAF
jgi:hypothetical protein